MSSLLDMGEKHELVGKWWLPRRPTRKVTGRLVIEPGRGIRLILEDTLTPNAKTPPLFESKMAAGWHSRIFGLLSTGEEVTLWDCQEVHVRFTMSGYQDNQFVVDMLVIGGHVATRKDCRFIWCQASFTGLEDWMACRPFKSGASDYGSNGISIHHGFPKTPTTPVTAALSISYDFERNLSMHQSHQYVITHRAFIRYTSRSRPTSIDAFFALLKKSQDLLALLIGEPVYPRVYRAAMLSDEPTSPYIYHLYHARYEHRKMRITHQMEMIVPEAALGSGSHRVFGKWLGNWKYIETLVSLYMGSEYETGDPANDLLTLTQGIESYHRLRYAGHFVSKRQYARIANTLTAAIPQQTPAALRQSLKARIKFGNEVSLRSRLKEILLTIPEDCRHLIARNVGGFVAKTVDTRNYYTHYDESNKGQAVFGYELFMHNNRLRVLIAVLLLVEAGCPPPSIAQWLGRSRKFRSLARMPQPE